MSKLEPINYDSIKSAECQEVIDGIVDPFYIINIKDYTVTYANKAARALGVSKSCTCYALSHKSKKPCWEMGHSCPIQTILQTKKACVVEHIHYDIKGNPRYFEVNGYPIFDKDGEVKQVIEHTVDVTSRKIIEQEISNSEKRYRELYEGSRDGFVLMDMTGRIKEFNHAFQDMLGYSKEELLQKTFADLTPHHWQGIDLQVIRDEVVPLGYSKIYEKECAHKNGTVIPVELRTYLVKDDSAAPVAMWSFVRDISDRKRAEKELKDLQHNLQYEKKKLQNVLSIHRKMSTILHLNNLVDFVIEKATKILEVEKCSLMLLDENKQELVIRGAKGLSENFISQVRIKIGEDIAGTVAQKGRPILVNDVELAPFNRPKREGYKSKSFMIVPIKLHNKLIGVVNVADKKANGSRDFSPVDLRILCTIVRQAAIAIENANYYRELEFLSVSDPMTGIYNYRFFVRNLDAEIERLKRYEHPLCLMMLDIDNFKSYNDNHGHLEGDLLLKKISKAIKGNLRSVDIVCRYAGDEFVAILPETPIAEAKIVAQKIYDVIQRLKCKEKVSVSIGVGAVSPKSDRRDLILKTDQALYQAKREGKNRICCFQ